MKHYLKTLEETIRRQWDQKSLCDYEGDSFTYADVATSIEQFRIFLVEAGITKRSKIAICARNCARWAMTFWDINVNECVAVPLLADFHPNSISTFTHHSDSVLLFTDKEIWEGLNPGQMPNLRAAINVKDRSMLWHRDEKVAEAWENREKAFAQKYPFQIPMHSATAISPISPVRLSYRCSPWPTCTAWPSSSSILMSMV